MKLTFFNLENIKQSELHSYYRVHIWLFDSGKISEAGEWEIHSIVKHLPDLFHWDYSDTADDLLCVFTGESDEYLKMIKDKIGYDAIEPGQKVFYIEFGDAIPRFIARLEEVKMKEKHKISKPKRGTL